MEFELSQACSISLSVCYYVLNLLRDYKGGNDAFVFSVMLYIVSRKRHCFCLLYLRHSSTNFNR